MSRTVPIMPMPSAADSIIEKFVTGLQIRAEGNLCVRDAIGVDAVLMLMLVVSLVVYGCRRGGGLRTNKSFLVTIYVRQSCSAVLGRFVSNHLLLSAVCPCHHSCWYVHVLSLALYFNLLCIIFSQGIMLLVPTNGFSEISLFSSLTTGALATLVSCALHHAVVVNALVPWGVDHSRTAPESTSEAARGERKKRTDRAAVVEVSSGGDPVVPFRSVGSGSHKLSTGTAGGVGGAARTAESADTVSASFSVRVPSTSNALPQSPHPGGALPSFATNDMHSVADDLDFNFDFDSHFFVADPEIPHAPQAALVVEGSRGGKVDVLDADFDLDWTVLGNSNQRQRDQLLIAKMAWDKAPTPQPEQIVEVPVPPVEPAHSLSSEDSDDSDDEVADEEGDDDIADLWWPHEAHPAKVISSIVLTVALAAAAFVSLAQLGESQCGSQLSLILVLLVDTVAIQSLIVVMMVFYRVVVADEPSPSGTMLWSSHLTRC